MNKYVVIYESPIDRSLWFQRFLSAKFEYPWTTNIHHAHLFETKEEARNGSDYEEHIEHIISYEEALIRMAMES